MISCPPRDQLRAILTAGATPTDLETIETHLKGCASCLATLDDLSDDQDLRDWRDGRTPVPGPPVPGPPACAPRDLLDPARRPGDLGSLGTNRVEALIGKGGMGYVFRAWDEALNRAVAVKVLRPDLDSPDARRRFVREAQTAAGLRHEHVVTVYGVFDPPEGVPYFTMELLTGPTLADRLKVGPLPTREAVDLVAQAADGVAAAHAAGLVHRDIKPANILGDPATGAVKVADFGLARDAVVPSGLTQDGAVVGTPHYLSPEQAAGEPRLDARADVYSLGATLYETLTGTTPFRGTPLAVLRQVLHDSPTPPRRLNADLPRAPEVICLKAMARDPGRRYATAAELRDDLRRWLDGRPVVARPAGPTERALLWSRRNPLAVALIAVFLVGFATSVWGWARAADKATETAGYAATAHDREIEATASASLAADREGEAVRARQVADDKSRLAEERALQALETINTLVFKAHQLAGNTPGTLALKQQLAEAALADLRKLAAGRDHIPGADRTRFAALMKLADTYTLLGRTTEAAAEWEKAAGLADTAVAAAPDDPGPRRELATALVRLVYVHRRNGDAARAAGRIGQAVGALEAAAGLAPRDTLVTRELAVAYNVRGDVEQDAGSRHRALAAYGRALTLVEQLAAADPARVLYQSDLRYTHARLGMTAGMMLDFTAAESHYRAAEAAAAKGLALDPGNLGMRRDWHVSLLDRADAQSRLGDYAGAETTCREALRHLAPAAAADPDNALAQRDLGIAHSLLGVALIGVGRNEDGQKELEESLALRERVWEKSRGSALVGPDLPVITGLLILNAERMRRFDEAAKWCDHAIEVLRRLRPGGTIDAASSVMISRLDVSKEAYALAAKAGDDPVEVLGQKPGLAERVLCVRAHVLARGGRLADSLAVIDAVRPTSATEVDVQVYRAVLYSYCAGKTSDPALREKWIGVALASLVEIARWRSVWFQDLSYYPELMPVRSHPEFVHRLRDAIHKSSELGPRNSQKIEK